MIRQDALYMAHLDWEPQVPSAEILISQLQNSPEMAGSVRGALGLIVGMDNDMVKRPTLNITQKETGHL